MNGVVRELNVPTFSSAERYVALALDEISLLVAQSEVQALEPVLDVKPAAAAETAGVLHLASGECEVYALDADLNRQPRIPPAHRICAIMNHRSRPYAISCKEVRLLARQALTARPIPKPLQSSAPTHPINGLIVVGDELLLGTTAAALFAHISRGANADVISFDERTRRLRG